jgi:hypothetical protein
MNLCVRDILVLKVYLPYTNLKSFKQLIELSLKMWT